MAELFTGTPLESEDKHETTNSTLYEITSNHEHKWVAKLLFWLKPRFRMHGKYSTDKGRILSPCLYCFEPTLWNMTLYTCFSVWNCIVVMPINTGKYTSSMHQYRHIHNTRQSADTLTNKTPGRRDDGSIRIARPGCFASSPAQCKLDTILTVTSWIVTEAAQAYLGETTFFIQL